MSLVVPIACALAWLLCSGAVLAEHEANHRYNVRGYVLSDEKIPIKGVGVSVRVRERVLGNAKTDSNGYYSIQTHLHDSDLGKKLTLRTRGGEGEVRVSFEAGNRTKARLHHVNFIGGELVEGELSGAGRSMWAYVGIVTGVATLGAAAAALIRRRKKLAKQRIAAQQPKPQRKPRKRKRKSR